MKIGNMVLSQSQVDKLFLVAGHIANKEMYEVVDALRGQSSYGETDPPFERVDIKLGTSGTTVFATDIVIEDQ